MGFFFNSQLEKNAAFKRKQRDDRLAALKEYQKPVSSKEIDILNETVAGAVKRMQNSDLSPREVLKAYGKQALVAHAKTNALTEIMLEDAEKWADRCNLSGPLGGFPVSLKDPFIVEGYDALAGYAAFANKPFEGDGAMAKIIRAAGGYPYVKTNVPSTMMAIEGYNDVWGRTTNPHNANYAPGGSSQGEGALIAAGGSRIGVGTDIGGSVRVPAAWSGITSLRMTTFRFPLDGDISCDGGFEGVQYVASPMAKTIGDLRYFIEAIFSVKPWLFDYHLTPLPWRTGVKVPEKPRVGVLRLDELLPLTPAQDRALKTATDALKKRGCEIIEFTTPAPARDYDENVFELYEADAYEGPASPLLKGEHNDPYVESIMKYASLPWIFRKAWESFLRLFGYSEKANMYARQHKLSVIEYARAVTRRESLRRGFRKTWDDLGIDFMITAPHPSPAFPNLVPESFRTILYTSLFNLLDYPSGIIPVGRVDASLDKLPSGFQRSKLTYEAKVTFDVYDAEKMAGLPISVQVVGMRYQDEETLAAMEYLTDALSRVGVTYK